jgi:hypothetical protein
MARAQQEFHLYLTDSSGNPHTGQTVELNRGAVTESLTEVGNGIYKITAIDVGQWRVVVNSTPTNRYVGVGTGEVSAPDYTNNPNCTMTTDANGNPQWTGPLDNLSGVEEPTASFTAQSNKAYAVDTSAGNVVVTLPTTDGTSVYIIKATADANTVTFDQNVNGSSTFEFNTQYEKARLIRIGGVYYA